MSVPPRADIRATLRDCSGDLLSYFERRVTVREDAADLLGETLLVAWRRIDRLPDDAERRRMWLFGVAANVLANHRRAQSRRGALTERLRRHLATEPPAADAGEVHAVRDAVRRLPDQQRELIMLVHWEGFSVAAAAEILGVNASTARSRYAAGKAALHAALTGARVTG